MLFLKNQKRVLLKLVASLGLSASGIFVIAQEVSGFSDTPVFKQDSGTEKQPSKSKGREVVLKGRASDDGTGYEILGVVDAVGTLENLTTLDEVRAMPKGESVEPEGGGEGLTGYGAGGYGAAGAGMPGGEKGMAAGGPGMSGGGMAMSGGGMAMPGGGMSPASPPDGRQIAMQKINQIRSKLASPDEDRAEVENQLRSALSEYFIADLQHRVRELDAVKAKVQQMEARLQKRLDLRQEAVDLQLKRMQHEADGLEFVVPNDSSASAGMGGMMGGEGYSGMTGGSLPGAAGGYPGGAAGSTGGNPFGETASGSGRANRTSPIRPKGK